MPLSEIVIWYRPSSSGTRSTENEQIWGRPKTSFPEQNAPFERPSINSSPCVRAAADHQLPVRAPALHERIEARLRREQVEPELCPGGSVEREEVHGRPRTRRALDGRHHGRHRNRRALDGRQERERNRRG